MSNLETTCSAGCQTAVGWSCECHCGGAGHGVGRIRWASASAAAAAGDNSPETAARVKKWDTAKRAAKSRLAKLVRALKPKPGNQSEKEARRSAARSLTTARATGAAEYVRTVVTVNWLVEHDEEREQIEWLAGEISKLGVSTLDKLARSDVETRRRVQRRLADHFWCDCLAAIVATIDEVTAVQEEIKSKTSGASGRLAALGWGRILGSRRSSHGYHPQSRAEARLRSEADQEAGLDAAVLEGAVAGVVKLALDGLMAGPAAEIELLVTKLRVLALIMCPDPVGHETVWKHCWLPLVEMFLKDELVEELHQFVKDGLDQPHSWDGPEALPPAALKPS
ncbi:hypothetical protein ACFVDI_19600 [Nocardioides sp. NPDC057767]|uniref:hypothetical protein n=1 Tax=unclassified Nocardioides TaxID=2615069 RepID=UPI00366FF24B